MFDTPKNLEAMSTEELQDLANYYEAQADVIARGVRFLGEMMECNSLVQLRGEDISDAGALISLNMSHFLKLNASASSIQFILDTRKGAENG